MRQYRLRPVPPERDPEVREMLGLAKGILCDGAVSDAELLALRQWLMCHSAVLDCEPGIRLGARLLEACADGCIDAAERAELTTILRQITT